MSLQITKDQIVNSDAEQLKQLLNIGANIACAWCVHCTYCMHCADCANCSDCTGCTDCKYCADCMYCVYCTNCDRCLSCTRCWYCFNSQNQENKQYVFCNVQLTEDEYCDALRKVS